MTRQSRTATRAAACILTLAAMLSACRPKLPAGILSESKMERVLYDYHMAQGMAEAMPPEDGQTQEQLHYEIYQALLRKHRITEAELDSSMVFYCSDLDRMNRIYKHVTRRLQREADAMGISTAENTIYHGLTNDGDTADVWADRPIFVLTPRQTDNLQTWQLQCDSTWLEGDDIIWHFASEVLSKGMLAEAFADIVVTYSNDSVRSQLVSLNSRRDSELRLNNPKDWLPRTITGHLYCHLSAEAQDIFYIFVQQNALIRLHKSQIVRDRWKQNAERPDSLLADSLLADSVAADSILPGQADHRRTPNEFREEQVVDRRINVVKEKPYQPLPGGRRRINNTGNRRRLQN